MNDRQDSPPWSTETAAAQRAADRENQAPTTHGPTIANRIEEQIVQAWTKIDRLQHDYDEQTSDVVEMRRLGDQIKTTRGRVFGLAQALAILRLAPNTPTTQQIKSIAGELRP